MIDKKIIRTLIFVLSVVLVITSVFAQSNSTTNVKPSFNKTLEIIHTQSLSRVHVVFEVNRELTDVQREYLKRKDFLYVKYIGGNNYIFSIPSSKINELQELELIKTLRDVDINQKLPYEFKNRIYPAYAKESSDRYKLVVKFYDKVLFEDAYNLAKKYGEVINNNFDFNHLTVVTPTNKIEILAEEDMVQLIEFIRPSPLAGNNGTRMAISTDIVQNAPYSLSGSNIDAGVWDGGKIDNSHDDFGNRITIVESSGSYNSHATHVAGTLGGDGIKSSGIYKGVAPVVNMYSYNFYGSPDPGNPASEHNNAINTYGVDLSQNSWGDTITNSTCNLFGDYSTREGDYDKIVKGHYNKKIPVTFSVHNYRDDPICNISQNGGYSTIAAPGTAKNVISVGATNSYDDSMTAFSGWGPTDDGRLKPDLVAPGCENDNIGTDSNDPSKSIWSTKSTNTYGGNCGTSMAAPAVSGSVALMYQQFRCSSWITNDPLPSTIKALLVHTAKDLGITGPDYKYGHGRINATEAIDYILYRYFREDNLSGASETDKFNFTINDSSKPVKVTLVWDDKEGTTNSTMNLINDLDLYLKAPNGTIFKSWTLDPNNPSSPATKGGNHRDNVEQVVVGPPVITNGSWIIIVNATSCPECPQTYSLVYKRPWEIKLFPPELGSDAGWNFFSVPVKPYKNITELFQGQCPNPNVARIYEWDAKTQGWTTHLFCETVNTLVGHLKPGHAYWILNATGTLTIPVDGDPITNVSSLVTTSVQLYIGNDRDNHVSFNSFFEIPTNESIKGLNITKFWQYKGGKTSLKRNNWDIYYDNETFEQAEFNLRPGAGLRILPKNSFNLTIPQTRSCSSLAISQNTLSAASLQDEPFVVYGSAHCLETLNKSSQNVTIRLRMGSTEITNYTMGEVDINQYRLQVPVGEAGINVNDTAEILINNVSAGNVTVGESGELVYLNITANSTTDVDGDNFSSECSDCNDNNASTNPDAPEICNDNIDNNCNGKIDCADSSCTTDVSCAATNITISSLSNILSLKTYKLFEMIIKNSGQSSLNNISWSLDLGDGTVVKSVYNKSLGSGNTTFVYVEHNYSNEGDYTITANATDVTSNISTSRGLEINSTISIKNLKQLYSNLSRKVYEFNLTNNADRNVSVNWTIDFGDGNVVNSILTSNISSGKGVLTYIQHNYSTQGDYKILVTAQNGSTIVSSKIDIELEYLGVSNFSVLNSSGTLMTFEAYVKNYMNAVMNNVSWSLNTGNGIVSSTSPITLQSQESTFVFVKYNYTATGTFAANFTAVNGSWNDLEALNVTIT